MEPQKWRERGDEICPMYRKEYESRRLTRTLSKAAWLRHVDSREDYYELPLLAAKDGLLNPRRSPARSVVVEVKLIVATNVEQSRVNDMPGDDDVWDFIRGVWARRCGARWCQTTISVSSRIMSR